MLCQHPLSLSYYYRLGLATFIGLLLILKYLIPLCHFPPSQTWWSKHLFVANISCIIDVSRLILAHKLAIVANSKITIKLLLSSHSKLLCFRFLQSWYHSEKSGKKTKQTQNKKQDRTGCWYHPSSVLKLMKLTVHH